MAKHSYPFVGWENSKVESLCRQCGKCCYEKLRIGKLIFYTEQACRFLNEETKKCLVYPRRHVEQWNCLPLKEIIEQESLPSDCPYIQDIKDYSAPIEGMLDVQLQSGLEKGEEEALNELIERMEKAGRGDQVEDLFEDE